MRLKRPLLAAACAAGLLVPTAGHADSTSIDFESYTTGTIDQQDGWSSYGAAGFGCAKYDHEVTANAGAPASFGSKSLRMSNAVTSGCFGDQTFSKSLANSAGEPSAENGPHAGGTRQTVFLAKWDFASVVPTAEQPGLSVVASPDRGDGARMSWVQMADTPTGLAVNFYDYKSADGTCNNGEFVFSEVAVGLDRTKPHTIRVAMLFLDGPGNDVVVVTVDGVAAVKIGTSWEDYFRECEGNPSRTVDSILFRTGGGSAPGTMGKGFVIDNLRMHSYIGDLPTDLLPTA